MTKWYQKILDFITLSKFFKFIKDALTSSSGVSSKRTVGLLCIIVYQYGLISAMHGLTTITPTIQSLLIQDLYVGGALLGLGLFDSYFKLKQTT